jgi:hypothetical protein
VMPHHVRLLQREHRDVVGMVVALVAVDVMHYFGRGEVGSSEKKPIGWIPARINLGLTCARACSPVLRLQKRTDPGSQSSALRSNL